MNETTRMEAEYFGLKVEVICRMEHCALVRFKEREFVVDAEDLKFPHTFRLTTTFGTLGTEQPFLKNTPKDFQYVLGLQEASVAARASRFLQATNTQGSDVLHRACSGLG